MRASAVATLFSLAAGASAFTVGGPAIVSRPVSFCVDGSRFLVSSCPRSKIIIQTLTRAISMRISLVLGGGNAMVLPKQIPPGLAHEDVAVQSYEQSGCAVFISFMLTINLVSIIYFVPYYRLPDSYSNRLPTVPRHKTSSLVRRRPTPSLRKLMPASIANAPLTRSTIWSRSSRSKRSFSTIASLML